MQVSQPILSGNALLSNPQGSLDGGLFSIELPLHPTASNGSGKQFSDLALQQVSDRLFQGQTGTPLTAASIGIGREIMPLGGLGSLGHYRLESRSSNRADALIGNVSTLVPMSNEDVLASSEPVLASFNSPPLDLKIIQSGAIALALAQLRQFVADPTFADKMQTAFGNQWNLEAGRSLVNRFTRDDATNPLLRAEILPSDLLKAAGAYAASNQTIYLSQDFLAQNATDPATIAAVLLEELGHHIDAQLNQSDSPGDEGAIFATLVQGTAISQPELAALKAEDDAAVVMLNGQAIAIERATPVFLERQLGQPGDVLMPNSDFDGDGKTDLAIWRPSNGSWQVLTSSSNWTNTLFRYWGIGGDVPLQNSDFDGDGKTDVGVWRPSDGKFYIPIPGTDWNYYYDRSLGQVGDIPIQGADFDGDGKTDVGIWRPSTGTWSVLTSSSNWTTGMQRQLGQAGDVLVPNTDFDGDGKTDLAVWRPSDGSWQILPSTNNWNTLVSRYWGINGDTPLQNSDFDGDHHQDVGVWRPSNGSAYVPVPGTNWNYYYERPFGQASDTPLQGGDVDGDGRTDVGVWRSSDGAWLTLTSSSNWQRSYVDYLGQAGDIPIFNSDFNGDGKTDLAVWRPSTGTWLVKTAPSAIASGGVTFTGNASDNTLQTGGGDDTLNGLGGNDTINAFAGNDLLTGGTGDDRLFGGDGNDDLWGEENNDTLDGQNGDDLLVGAEGDDRLYGGAGSDRLYGGAGSDILQGSDAPVAAQIDRLMGDAGADQFILGTTTTLLYDDGNATTVGTGDYAIVTDFNPTAGDTIQLQGASIGGSTSLQLQGSAAANYFLIRTGTGLPDGIAIYRDKPGTEPDELIGVVQGAPGISLSISPNSGGGGVNNPGGVTVRLAQDTAANGATNTDGITSKPTVTGTVATPSQVVELAASFNNFVNGNSTMVAVTNGSFTIDPTQLATINGGSLVDGAYTLYLRSKDTSGNWSNAGSVTFKLDTTAPDLQVTKLIDGIAWKPGEQLGVQVSNYEAGTMVSYRFDAQPELTLAVNSAALMTHNLTLPTTIGTHALTVSSTDAAGNPQAVTYNFLVKDTSPVLDNDVFPASITVGQDPTPSSSNSNGQPGSPAGPSGSWGYIGIGGGWGSATGSGGWTPYRPDPLNGGGGGEDNDDDQNPPPNQCLTYVGSGYGNSVYIQKMDDILDYAVGSISNHPTTAPKKAALYYRENALEDIARWLEAVSDRPDFDNTKDELLFDRMQPVLNGVFDKAHDGILTTCAAANAGYDLARAIVRDPIAVRVRTYEAALFAVVDRVFTEHGYTMSADLVAALQQLSYTYVKLNPNPEENTTSLLDNFLDPLWRIQAPNNNGFSTAQLLDLSANALVQLLEGVSNTSDSIDLKTTKATKALQFINNLIQATTNVASLNQAGTNGEAPATKDARFLRELVDFGFEYAKLNPVAIAGAETGAIDAFLGTLWQGKADTDGVVTKGATGKFGDLFEELKTGEERVKFLDFGDRLLKAAGGLSGDLEGEKNDPKFLSAIVELGGAYAALRPSISPREGQFDLFLNTLWQAGSEQVITEGVSELDGFLKEFESNQRLELLKFESNLLRSINSISKGQDVPIPTASDGLSMDDELLVAQLGPGPWSPTGNEPASLYIGNQAHLRIANVYSLQHGTDLVFTNFTPISTILLNYQRLGQNVNFTSLTDSELNGRPDILNSPQHDIYEIKSFTQRDLAVPQARQYQQAFEKAGVNIRLGSGAEPGTSGIIEAPGGYYLFSSYQNGAIIYRYRRGTYENSFVQQVSNATGLTGGALLLYLIFSEGSRILFPPRNAFPLP